VCGDTVTRNGTAPSDYPGEDHASERAVARPEARVLMVSPDLAVVGRQLIGGVVKLRVEELESERESLVGYITDGG